MSKKNRGKSKSKTAERLEELEQLEIQELDNVQETTEIAIGDGPIQDFSDNFIDSIPVNTPASFDVNNFSDENFFVPEDPQMDAELAALAAGQHIHQPGEVEPVQQEIPVEQMPPAQMTPEYLATMSLEFSRRSVEASEKIASLLENNLVLLHQVHTSINNLAAVVLQQ